MNKNAIIALMCVVVILIAAIVTISRSGSDSDGPTPISDQTGKFMAVGTDKVIEMTVGDYKDLQDNDDGEKTLDGKVLRRVIDCPHCQAQIPAAPPKFEEAAALNPETSPEYKCPKCGKNVLKLLEGDGATE